MLSIDPCAPSSALVQMPPLCMVNCHDAIQSDECCESRRHRAMFDSCPTLRCGYSIFWRESWHSGLLECVDLGMQMQCGRWKGLRTRRCSWEKLHCASTATTAPPSARMLLCYTTLSGSAAHPLHACSRVGGSDISAHV